ncbi:MAG TPA: hypothetical protein VLM38_02305 [Blastocatellia bacterium]|nr:hypothetical protein [Blastocatellia bacterium]
MAKPGFAALGCYAVHAGFHLFHGRPEEMLWSCHLGAAAVGVGLLSSSAIINGIGILFLLMGTPLWVMYLAGGGEFYPTSCFTHLGGLAIALYGVRRLAFPRGTWWKAVVALVALIAICRLVTPPQANVNVAFAIYAGWEKVYPSYPVYLATMIVLAAGYFLLSEYALRRWLVPKPAREAVS